MTEMFTPSKNPILAPSVGLCLYVMMWIPAMVAASYSWIYGDYYAYGWFVPLAAIGLIYKRWTRMNLRVGKLKVKSLVVFWCLVLPLIFMLRVLGYADPAWRLPMGLLGLLAAMGGHLILAVAYGWKVSASFGFITLLWLSALPWPVVLERSLVHHLTDSVVAVAAEVFHLLGKPVEIAGDRLRLNELTVEVTDGCSGIRSFQSFVMASCFFSEFQSLKFGKAFTLLGFACMVAFLTNLARTYALAEIRFSIGLGAFEQAHDVLGLLAFAVSGLAFYVFSGRLAETRRLKAVRTVRTIQ
jgi:exosortase